MEEARQHTQDEKLSQSSRRQTPVNWVRRKVGEKVASLHLHTGTPILDYVESLESLVATRSIISQARAVARRNIVPEKQHKMIFTKRKGKELTKELRRVSKYLSKHRKGLYV